MGRKIKIAGLDGSLRNFGIALLDLDIETLEMTVDDLILSETTKASGKQVRASSDLFARAKTTSQLIDQHVNQKARLAFCEIPSGGQSYSAVIGFGIVIGLYASIKRPVIEVSPAETKLAAVGTRTASKEEMIDWAVEKYPTAPWLTQKRKGVETPLKKNEHLADAVAIAHAGLKVPSFQQALSILRGN